MKITLILSWFGLWPRPARIADVRFPAIVVPADRGKPWVAAAEGDLLRRDPTSGLMQSAGATLIDAELRQFRLRDVRIRRRSDIAWLLSYLFPIKERIKHDFDLRRRWSRGPAAARRRMARGRNIGDKTRLALEGQTTQSGMIGVLVGSPPPVVAPGSDVMLDVNSASERS